MKRNKKAIQREKTYQNLIESGECLFSEYGIDAVSLRQIGEKAGSLNTNVIGYYFGTKTSLIEAIYKYRLPEIEQWRSEFLKDLDRRGLGMDLGELLKAIWVPLYELTDENGRHSYGRFLLSVDRAGLGWTRLVLDPDYPAGSEAHQRIIRILKEKNVSNLDFRFKLHIIMVLETLFIIDTQHQEKRESLSIFHDALEMAKSGLLSDRVNTVDTAVSLKP